MTPIPTVRPMYATRPDYQPADDWYAAHRHPADAFDDARAEVAGALLTVALDAAFWALVVLAAVSVGRLPPTIGWAAIGAAVWTLLGHAGRLVETAAVLRRRRAALTHVTLDGAASGSAGAGDQVLMVWLDTDPHHPAPTGPSGAALPGRLTRSLPGAPHPAEPTCPPDPPVHPAQLDRPERIEGDVTL